jgi:hypothetical protein
MQLEDGRLFERHTVKSFAYVMHLAAKKRSEDMLVMVCTEARNRMHKDFARHR